MSKLPNVKGRISYITSHAKQEYLYATYRTADNTFWSNLARESQQEFLRSGTKGKCIEARELIIALPEIYTTFPPQQVLEEFTDKFRQQYGVECVSALHHNKRKTNYHIHLIFSERKLLPEPDIKIATRSVFYDETGKRVRTKKEITDKNGQVRKGCTVIKKGDVYESHLFKTKDERFKSEAFIAEAKEVYTELINSHISDPEQRLKVFDKNSVYLPTKKIGKNNPKAAEIEADNTARQEWNRTADLALVSGIEETKILEIKKEEIRLDELLLDANELVLKAHPDYHIELIFEQEADDDRVLTVIGNPYLLTTAFVNLIENNCKYSDNRTSFIQISFCDQWTIVSLSDNGAGMSETDKENLFKLFYRGENKNQAQGHGIGMTLTKKILTLHKSEISVYSHQGEGTTFVVRFHHL